MTTDAQLDKTVDEARAADVDAMSGGIKDSKLEIAVQEMAAYLTAAVAEMNAAPGIIGFSDGSGGPPNIQMLSSEFNEIFGLRTDIKTKDCPKISRVEKYLLLGGVRVMCLEKAEFVRVEK